jgi:NinB protein
VKKSFTIAPGPHAQARMQNAWGIVQAIHNSGKSAVVTVGEETRSTLQNSRMWAMLTDVSRQVNWHGKKPSPRAWKAIFSASLKKQDVYPGLNDDFVVVGEETHKMSIREMSELMELMEAFGAEQGVKFSAAEREGIMT